jgi:hypothetical protein
VIVGGRDGVGIFKVFMRKVVGEKGREWGRCGECKC